MTAGPSLLYGQNFSVRGAGSSVIPFSDYAAILDKNRPDHRVGACGPPPLGCQAEGLLHEVDVCLDAAHRRVVARRGRDLFRDLLGAEFER